MFQNTMSTNKEYMDNNIIDEAEDTLSLSDLVTSYNATEWTDYFSRQSQSSSSISSSIDQELQDQYFEFFSEEWSTTTPENIIFCGKIIPSKNPLLIKNETQILNKKASSGLPKTYSRKRPSSPSSESKWHTLQGMARVLTGGMELKDVKKRQSRHSPSSSPLVGSDIRNHQEENVYRRRSRGLRGVIRFLSCGDYFHATNTKESMKSIPRV